MKFKTLGILLIVSVLVLVPAAVSAQDTVSSASQPTNDEQLVKALGEDGTWIIIFNDDYSTDKELVMEGKFENDGEVDRKLALYASDSDHNVTERYTLEAPSITVKSPSARFQNGTFVGDVYVESNNFALNGFTVDGDIYFETKEAKATFTVNGGTEITGDLINNF
ncbi:MAG: hypothetical protein K9K32_04790 [Halanaerobiales bacterium]|nr:hypothetical protein [Halanaerobiales bacterium]MCF8009061.1 hypothetical protein [Halanaerobiales bacterium]